MFLQLGFMFVATQRIVFALVNLATVQRNNSEQIRPVLHILQLHSNVWDFKLN